MQSHKSQMYIIIIEDNDHWYTIYNLLLWHIVWSAIFNYLLDIGKYYT